MKLLIALVLMVLVFMTFAAFGQSTSTVTGTAHDGIVQGNPGIQYTCNSTNCNPATMPERKSGGKNSDLMFLWQPTDGTVDSASARALAKAVADIKAQRAVIDDLNAQIKLMQEQAQNAVTNATKPQNDKIQAAQLALYAKVKADKRYAGDMVAIETMQKEVQAAVQKAQQDYAQKAQPLQDKINQHQAALADAQAQVRYVGPIVREESGLPAEAKFDEETGKWVVPPTAAKVEAKQ